MEVTPGTYQRSGQLYEMGERLDFEDKMTARTHALSPPPTYASATAEDFNLDPETMTALTNAHPVSTDSAAAAPEYTFCGIVGIGFYALWGGLYFLAQPLVELIVGLLYFESCYLALLTVYLGIVGLLAVIPTALFYGCEKACCTYDKNVEVPKRVLRLQKFRKAWFGILSMGTGIITGRNAYYVFTMPQCQKAPYTECYMANTDFRTAGNFYCSESMYLFVKYDLIARFACIGVLILIKLVSGCFGCAWTKHDKVEARYEDNYDDYY